jgi:hypothetical protein
MVATFVYASSQGQRTHSARTKSDYLDIHFKHFEVVFHWRSSSFTKSFKFLFGSQDLSLKVEEGQQSGYLDIPLLNILRSSSIGIFITFYFQFWFCPLSLCLKFEKDPYSGCRDNWENKEINLGDRVVVGGGWWFLQEIMPLRGPILQAESC